MTVREVQRAINEGSRDSLVLAMRNELVRSLPENDKAAEARAIYEFTRRAIRYTDDPPGHDTLVGAPWVIREALAGRRVPADCVTQTVLVGSLARSLGIPVRLRVIGTRHPRREFEHIHPELLIGGTWVSADVTAESTPPAVLAGVPGLGYRHPADLESTVGVAGLGFVTAIIAAAQALYGIAAGASAKRTARAKRKRALRAGPQQWITDVSRDVKALRQGTDAFQGQAADEATYGMTLGEVEDFWGEAREAAEAYRQAI